MPTCTNCGGPLTLVAQDADGEDYARVCRVCGKHQPEEEDE